MMPRTFRARSMPAALEAVEKELGTEALIVSVRQYPAGRRWQMWRKTGVEVVAIPPAVASLRTAAGASAETASLGKGPVPLKEEAEKKFARAKEEPANGLSPEHAAAPLKAETPTTKEPARPSPGLPAHLSRLQDRLLAQGVAAAVVESAVQTTAERLSAQALRNDELIRDNLRQQLQAGLRTNGGACLMNSRVICFIGANGAGKTSTAAKISAYAAKTLGKKVRWITADALRAGAIAKAQAFTAPMGIPLSLAYSPEELAELAKGESDTELVLIDTPGCNPYRAEEIQELGALLAGIPDRCTLLVAPATGKEADLQDEAAVFAIFHVQELVISKMDETHSYGCAYNFAYRNQLPIAYFTVGTRILGDLLPADSSFLVNALLG